MNRANMSKIISTIFLMISSDIENDIESDNDNDILLQKPFDL